MDTGERLAAYLAGELDADATRALEAELGRDPSLRARLASIRATDAALASLPPVEPPAGFAARLREAVAAELDEQLPTDGDELAHRRARKAQRGGLRDWWPQVAVAAAVLAVAGIGVATIGGGAGDADMAALEADAGTESAATMALPEAQAGPTVVAEGRSFDAGTLPQLADDPRFDELTRQGLAGEGAEAAADAYGSALEAPRIEAEGDAEARIMEDAGPTDGAGGAGDPAGAAIGLRTEGEVTADDLEDVRRCLDDLLQAETAVIPVYAELVDFEGQDAIVYGLVGNDPAQDRYRRVELWVVGRGDCSVLHFAQVDR